MKPAAVALAFAAMTLLRGSAQAPDGPRLAVDAPSADAYLSGPTTLKASVLPGDAADMVTFYVDGRQICTLSGPPWECEYDAGAAIAEHQVRVVATLKAGGRLVQTVRTKSLGYVERVDVDVVHVTVTISDGHGKFIAGIPQSAFHVFED